MIHRAICIGMLALCATGCAQRDRAEQAAARMPAAASVAPARDGATPAEPTGATPRRPGWIDTVADAHALADAATEPAAVERAIAALGDAFESGPSLPDAIPPRQDLAGRIAGLHRRLEQPEQARQWARTGLELGGPETVFTAHLHLEEALAADALGDAPAAAAARSRARAINAALANRPMP